MTRGPCKSLRVPTLGTPSVSFSTVYDMLWVFIRDYFYYSSVIIRAKHVLCVFVFFLYLAMPLQSDLSNTAQHDIAKCLPWSASSVK